MMQLEIEKSNNTSTANMEKANEIIQEMKTQKLEEKKK
jgi:hypothetical protein